jgi:hypothetical protein
MTDLVERKRLPNRRCHEVVEFTHNGFGYTAGFGRFDDGKLAEVFLNADKVGTAIETQALGKLLDLLTGYKGGAS